MSTLSQKDADLSPQAKRALLAELLRNKSAKSKVAPTSFAQRRLWFLDQLEPHGASFNISRATRMIGALQVGALKQTLNALVARHESLRTNFGLADGEPVQIISSAREIVLPMIDLRGLDSSEAELETRRLATRLSNQGFDLTSDNLLRAVLFRLNHAEHVLLLSIHHIISDGWSMGVLVRELDLLYQAFSKGQLNPLPPLPIQYADFARWQLEWFRGEVLQKQLLYWTKQLAGAPPFLDLPTDRPRPAVQTFNGAYHVQALPKLLSRDVVDLSRQERVTLFMTLLAAFQILVGRYAHQDDVVVGTPTANRDRQETEGLIGFFVNTLVMRTDLSGNPTFRDLLRRTREVALAAYEHQDLPFERLVEALKPERSLRHSPVFQVLFAMQNIPKWKLTLESLELETFVYPRQNSKLDLSLYASESDAGLFLSFEYNTDLFDRTTVARIAGHFETLLKAIVADPDQPIADLALMPEPERLQLSQWNQTEVAFCGDTTIHQLFEEQAARTPDAAALILGEQRMTFGELNERANQLAHFIRKRGVRTETRVAICLERSPALFVGVLGILKAGAAYVPLEPAYPLERAAFIFADSQARLLLTEKRLLGQLPVGSLEVVCLDRDREAIAVESATSPGVEVDGDNAAYVIYTSGSTGEPKGAIGLHRGMINRFAWMWSTYPFRADDVGCQKTSITFLDSMWEMFGTLLKGVPVVIIPDDEVRDTHRLVRALEINKVTRIVLVPSLLRAILQLPNDDAKRLKKLRLCVSSGEALPLELAQDFRKQLPQARLLNLYGSSEVSADETFYEVGDTKKFLSVPIGRPIANTQIHLLDEKFRAVPIGVVGDIYVSGEGLCRGYLNRPDFTAEKVLANSFSDVSGSRLFKTGDLGRYLNDGTLEYRGRRDHQVKVRGFRIELEEIEAALTTHSGVRQAVVVAREEPEGDKRIVAYIVPHGLAPAANELRDHLRARLLDYMIPAAFVFLDEFPLTAGGKIDRLALPAPSTTLARERVDVGRPRTECELALKNIWQTLLQVSPVGIRDNFFELGGHSLLAVRMMNEVEKLYHRRIPVMSLFQSATIEHLANILQQDAKSMSWPTFVEIQAGNDSSPLFCVSTPNANALGYRTLSSYLGPERTIYGLQAQYPEDHEGEHSQKAVDELATDYLEALRAVQPRGPYQLIGMCRGAHIAFEMSRRLEDQGEKVALLGILDTWVMENTYNRLLYVKSYFRRLRTMLRSNTEKKVGWFTRKLKGRNGLESSPAAGSEKSSARARNPLHIYFPGPGFVPKTYNGRITVFRIRRQPIDRIRDKELGWGKLATGGVDLHYVTGKHGQGVLREPHVRVLATELKKCLLN